MTKYCVCPKCGQFTEQYHGTYVRHVQDLSILGKNVRLHIKAHEYKCTNTDYNAGSRLFPSASKFTGSNKKGYGS